MDQTSLHVDSDPGQDLDFNPTQDLDSDPLRTWNDELELDLDFNPPRTWTLNLPWTWTPHFWFLRAGSAALAIMDSGLSLRRWC